LTIPLAMIGATERSFALLTLPGFAKAMPASPLPVHDSTDSQLRRGSTRPS
jgi:hypothetical protein